MKNSKTTIRELTAKYKSVLKKCAFLNAIGILAFAGVANATETMTNIPYDYPSESSTRMETVWTVTGNDPAFPLVNMSSNPIINIGTNTETATVTDSGSLSLINIAQLNVSAGSSLTFAGSLTNEGKTFYAGDVGLDYDGPRYIQIYTKEGVDTRDENAYAINNFGTITASEIRNKETIINYVGSVINGNVYNILTVDINGNPLNMPTIENRGTINGNVVNSGKFFSGGMINGDVSNTGTLTVALGNINGTIDNGNGTLNTWGTLDRDLNGTVEFIAATTLNAGDAYSLNGVATNSDILTVNGDLTVSNAYSSFSNYGTLTIAAPASVTSNILNTGIINNYGAINGNVTNQTNSILNTELSSVSGKIYNYGTLNTWGTLTQTDFNNKLADSADKTLNLINTSNLASNLNAQAINLSSTLNTNAYELKSTALYIQQEGRLNVATGGKFNGVITTNAGSINNAGTMVGTITNNNELINTGSIKKTSGVNTIITNNGNLTNNGKIENATLTNTGILYNQTASTTGTGIADTDITNNGMLVNSGKIINTVTNDTAANPAVSNTHTLMNYGYIQAKNFTNNGIIHNLGVMGDNITEDGTIASNYSKFQNNSVVYNNRIIKADSVINDGTIENYNMVNARVLTNNGALRNENVLGAPGDVIRVFNYNSLYNGGTIYGDVINYAGAEMTSPIFTISGTLTNNGTLNTWGRLESVNPISLGGTTNLIYDSSLKKNATMGTVNVKNGVTLDLETNKLTAHSFNIEANSVVKLNVKSKDEYGSVQATNYSYSTFGTKVSFVLDRGILTEGKTITLPVFMNESGDPINLNLASIENNRYSVTKEDNGAYTISYAPSSSGKIIAYGGDQNVIRATSAWLDEEDMPENTKAEEIQKTLNTLNQTDMASYVKAVRSLMPETAPVAYTLANLINNKLAEAAEGRFMSRRTVQTIREQRIVRGRNSGDVVIPRTTGSIWAKGLYNKTKLDTKLGFDAKVDGVAVGIDGKTNDYLTLGVGYAYTGADVDSKSRETDVTTHTGMLYGEYANGQCFMNGVVSYSRSEYEEDKDVAETSADTKYTSDVAYGRVMGGFHIPVDYFIFTPETGLRYLWIKMNGYTDSDGQEIADESTSSLTGVVGLRVAAKTKLIGLDQVMFWPEVAVRGTYDIVDADNNVTVSLPNNSSYVVEGEKLKRFG
ncbi:MAG: autotransporter outer membrane beta-barrel domain-containing protein, partial [Alphaproteobacteria bacterium]|nr:autotransporter outer membrane beta-barrel domain-containing protein [Alphaproteobacteria bacterium]